MGNIVLGDLKLDYDSDVCCYQNNCLQNEKIKQKYKFNSHKRENRELWDRVDFRCHVKALTDFSKA